MKHLKSGTYKEELQDLKYPYRNFKSGTPVDQICKTLEVNHGIVISENELIEYVYNNI